MLLDPYSYVVTEGISLSESGSAEKGFTKDQILDLLNTLQEKNIKPLGLEVWRRDLNGKHRIDSLAGWASSNSNDVKTSIDEVKAVISIAINEGPSIFTLQF